MATSVNSAIVEVTDANFEQEVLKSDKPVLVDFWAIWCGPCKAIAPLVDEVATKFQGRAKICKMDVDRNTATPMRYNVRGIPTLLFFKDGKIAHQHVGANVSLDQFEKVLTGLGA